MVGTSTQRIASKRGEKSKESENPGKVLMNKIDVNYNTIDFRCKRLSNENAEFNFKISAWNVAGLRALVRKSCHIYIEKEDPDIMCFSEVKCSDRQVPVEMMELCSLKGYCRYWKGSLKAGYAGVGMLTKKKPLSVIYGIENEEFDKEGRMITAEFEKFYLVTVYVPNAGQALVTLPKRMKWNELFKKFIIDLDKKKPVIICGDMNVAHKEIDLKNPQTNTKSAGFTIEERDAMTDFLESGFVDVYRYLYPEKEGAYTFWSYFGGARKRNTGWRLDYFIVSQRLINSVCECAIRSEILGSDHCPITLFLSI